MRQQRLRGYVIYLKIHSKGEVGRGVSRIWSLAVELLCQHSLPQCYIVPGSLSCKICKIQPILIQYERMHHFLDACCSLKLCKNRIFKNVNPPNSCVLLLTGEVMRIKIVPTSRFLWDSFRLVYDAYCCCSLVAKSCLTLCDPMDYIAHQAPLSMGFSRQEYWSGLPCPPPGDLPDPVIKPKFPALADRFFTTEPPGKFLVHTRGYY